MRIASCMAACLVAVFAASVVADRAAFTGRWNITGTGVDADHVYWLEITDEEGSLTGRFLNRGGSPVPLQAVSVEGDELVFRPAGGGNQPAPEHRARLEGDKLVGAVTVGERTIEWVGVRPPKWGHSDANARHTRGAPVELFAGRSLDAWDVQHQDRPSGWSVVDGAMTNEPEANNLVSKQTFTDFTIRAEYRLDAGSNSGIYLRGRYELQVVDDYGKPAESHGHMSVYSWVAPRLNASRPAGEWQAMEATLVGNRLTVTLNDQTVHDNVAIEAITGGALDADESAPGPIMLQGDHGKVWFRKVTVVPITGTRSSEAARR